MARLTNRRGDEPFTKACRALRNSLARALLDVVERLIGAWREIALVLAFARCRFARNAGRIGTGCTPPPAPGLPVSAAPPPGMPRLGMSGPPAARGGDRFLRHLSLLTPLGRAMNAVGGSFRAPSLSSGSLAAKL